MEVSLRRRGLRRHLALAVSGTLVAGMGAAGLLAGHAAGQHAREVHREDRLLLQETLAGLTGQYVLISAAEVQEELGRVGAWSAVPGDPATSARLAQIVADSRSLDAGAVLLDGTGQPLGAWAPGGKLPAPDDPGWEPLRETATTRPGVLPVSGVMDAGGAPVLGLGLPAQLSDGSLGMLVGLWDPRTNGLQQYVSELEYGRTGQGYVVDGAGVVIAAHDAAQIGRPLPLAQVREALDGEQGLLDTRDGGEQMVTSYAAVGTTGWTALTPQTAEEFEGALVRSSRMAEYAVVALLLIAGGSLVVFHRRRERALEDVALRDELTGLYNRRGWFVLADHELQRARRAGTSRVLLFVDLDGLKRVNDALGHREGDRAIVDAAQVLQAATRSSDLVGRLGGDEFVVLLGDDGRPDIGRRRILEALDAHNARSSAAYELRLSVGAEVWFPEHAWGLDELVRRADAEMYADKVARPGRHEGVIRLPSPRDGEPASADSAVRS